MKQSIINKRLIKKAILLENELYGSHDKKSIRKIFNRGDIKEYTNILRGAMI
jgi:uncharacterized Fe-S cluster-containing radical SAM superfamily enzyme